MDVWKEFCLRVWKWFVKKPRVADAKRSSEEKVANRYSPERMKRYLNAHYEFRYNVLSEINEFRPKGESLLGFKYLGKRELNALCL